MTNFAKPLQQLRWLPFLVIALSPAIAAAESATLLNSAELKSDHYTDANTLASFDPGARVDVIQRQGGWVKVRRGTAIGWLRTGSLTEAKSGASHEALSHPLLDLPGGRTGKDNLVATTGVRGFSKPPSTQIHALIMAIGAYHNGIPNLSGVKYDVASARQIAERMGVPDANMHILEDDALTLEGMRKAFVDLESSLSDGDQVFIYYSGHGGRQKVLETDGAERCAESLVTVDGYGFIDSEMESQLKRLSQKSSKVIALLDACHSGGVTTRSLSTNAPYTPKYWVGKGTSETCAKPTNVVTRGLSLGTKAVGSGSSNFVYIAASKDDEISFDQPGKGGVATGAWLECMAGAARDLDGSGGLSAEETRICAQARIDSQLGQSSSYLPHHVTLTGNSNMVLSYAPKELPAAAIDPLLHDHLPLTPTQTTGESPKPVATEHVTPAATKPAPGKPQTATAVATNSNKLVQSPSEPPKPVASDLVKPAATKPPATTIAGSPPPAIPAHINLVPETVAPVRPAPAATLADIYNSRDDRRLVTLSTNRPQVRIGKDNVSFELNSREPGYAYIVMVGSDGVTFDVLFPNKLDTNNQIRAGETLHLPAIQWQLTASGPAGKDTLLAIVSDAPRDFSKAGAQASGPFSSIEGKAAKDIQLVTGTSALSSGTECAASSPGASVTRNLTVQKRCSGAYGAALLTIDEIR